VALLVGRSPALAQDDEAEKSSFVRYVEDTISTPDRKISLGQIDGVLSSDVRISDITIADRQGVWLTINGAHLVWSRSALLSKKLDIDLLEAQSIVVTRAPLPPEGVQPASTEPFAIPDLPVVGLVPARLAHTLSPDEVERVIELDLDELRQTFGMRRLIRRGVPFRTPTFDVEGAFIWGATARMLQQFFERLDG